MNKFYKYNKMNNLNEELKQFMLIIEMTMDTYTLDII